MNYKIKDYHVYEVQELGNSGEALGCLGFATKIVISGKKTGAINEIIPFVAEFKNWEDSDLLEENSIIKLSIAGLEQEVYPQNGKVEFDFTSEYAGVFDIKASTVFPCEIAEIEVVISE